MALILNIDTSVNTTYVSVAKDGKVLQSFFSDDQKSNATNLHIAIQDLLLQASFDIKAIDAIGITNGPGSYTGLRVGLATAKGLCYALKIPLIVIGTLEMMAEFVKENENAKDCLLCPMIDARRMEVFTALYNINMVEIKPPSAIILDINAFEVHLKSKKILFFGNGMQKWVNINISDNAIFSDATDFYKALNIISFKKYKVAAFSELAYTEPLYVKEFYNP
jgi:tRNA threonylcarbamoyladenosine biosynthesis protein TsaB